MQIFWGGKKSRKMTNTVAIQQFPRLDAYNKSRHGYNVLSEADKG